MNITLVNHLSVISSQKRIWSTLYQSALNSLWASVFLRNYHPLVLPSFHNHTFRSLSSWNMDTYLGTLAMLHLETREKLELYSWWNVPWSIDDDYRYYKGPSFYNQSLHLNFFFFFGKLPIITSADFTKISPYLYKRGSRTMNNIQYHKKRYLIL